MSFDPIVQRLRLAATPGRAFETFTERIGEWWHPDYSANPATFSGAVMEPRVGGRVYSMHTDLGEVSWGEIIDWVPERRLAWAWTLAQDPAHPSLVEVAFAPDGDGSAVRFSHGGWTPENAGARSKFGDWPMLLARFARVADGT